MGKTLYFGRRGNEIMCRFYDKRKQMQDRYETVGKELPDHWVRCELELRNDRAKSFVKIFYLAYTENVLGVLFHEVLSNYMRVTDRRGDSNRSRWAMNEMWKRFNDAMINIRLTYRKQVKKIEDTYVWIKRSVAPTLTTLFKASGGDLDFLMDIIKEGGKRLSKKHLIMLAEYENRGLQFE